MRKTLFAALIVGLPALVLSCGSNNDGSSENGGSSGGSSATSTSGSQGGSSGKASSSSSTPSGGSSAASSSSAAAGSSAVAGSSSSSSKTSTGGSTGDKSSSGGTSEASSTSEGGAGAGGTTTMGGKGGTGKTGGTGGTGAGGTSSSKSTGAGGSTGGSTANTGTGGGYVLKNDPVPSSGCGQTLPSKYKAGADTTFKDMTSAGIKREYIVYIPTGYDPSKPSKLLFAWHCMGSSDTGAVQSGYYGVKQNDTGKNTILVAPQGYTDSMPWRSDDKDVTFFDDMLKLFKSELCIDESRVFSIGFSFGGMMTYSLSVARQKDIRAGVGIAPANYNIYVTKTKTHAPIGWMQTTGVNDTTCPWQQNGSSTNGSMYIGQEHGTDNGCTVPNPIPKWTSGNHLCVDFEGCKPGYPTKVCTFNGPHTDNSSEGGGNWIYTEGWKFLSQF